MNSPPHCYFLSIVAKAMTPYPCADHGQCHKNCVVLFLVGVNPPRRPVTNRDGVLGEVATAQQSCHLPIRIRNNQDSCLQTIETPIGEEPNGVGVQGQILNSSIVRLSASKDQPITSTIVGIHLFQRIFS